VLWLCDSPPSSNCSNTMGYDYALV
jgi:hypothetical protein